MKFCFCGGKYAAQVPGSSARGQCVRLDCPRARLGYGSWHVALLKLCEHQRQGQLSTMFPDLNLEDLQRHVDKMGKRLREEDRQRHADRLREERERRRVPERGHMQALRNDAVSETFYYGPKIPLQEPEEQPRGPKRFWRNPRQPEGPPPDWNGVRQFELWRQPSQA